MGPGKTHTEDIFTLNNHLKIEAAEEKKTFSHSMASQGGKSVKTRNRGPNIYRNIWMIKS